VVAIKRQLVLPLLDISQRIPFIIGQSQSLRLVLRLQNLLVCEWDLRRSALEKGVPQGEDVCILSTISGIIYLDNSNQRTLYS